MQRRALLRTAAAAGLAALRRRPAVWAGGRATFAAPTPPALPSWIAAVGDAEVPLAKPDRDRLGLPIWPDGNIGVLKGETAYTFFAPSHGKVARTVATLSNPAAASVQPELTIQNLKHTYDYAGGGSVYPCKGIP